MTPFFSSMLKLQESLLAAGLPHEIHIISNESAVHRARNKAVQRFLESEYSHMMFIDSDIEFTPEDVAKLWNLDADTSVGLCVGVYTMKKQGEDRYAAWHNGKLITDLSQFDEPFDVDYAGTGFMLISRATIKRIQEAHPERKYTDKDGEIHQTFLFPLNDNIELSEDYNFCREHKELGGRVLMDPSIKLGHYGLARYGNTKL